MQLHTLTPQTGRSSDNRRMETRKHTETGGCHPLAGWEGWEAATRWNRATLDWVATGWRQWVALMTTVPPHFMVPPTVTHDAARRATEQVSAAQAADAPLRRREPRIASARRRAPNLAERAARQRPASGRRKRAPERDDGRQYRQYRQ